MYVESSLGQTASGWIICGHEVGVRTQCHGWVLAETSGDGYDIDSSGEELGCHVVAKVVETDVESEPVT